MILPWIQMINDLAASQLEFPGWLGRFGFYFWIVLRAQVCGAQCVLVDFYMSQAQQQSKQVATQGQRLRLLQSQSLSGVSIVDPCGSFPTKQWMWTATQISLGKIYSWTIPPSMDFPSTSQGLYLFIPPLASAISHGWNWRLIQAIKISTKNQRSDQVLISQAATMATTAHSSNLNRSLARNPETQPLSWHWGWVSHPVIPPRNVQKSWLNTDEITCKGDRRMGVWLIWRPDDLFGMQSHASIYHNYQPVGYLRPITWTPK